VRAGQQLVLDLPMVPVRPLSALRTGPRRPAVIAEGITTYAAGLVDGLRRLKLATKREQATEVLQSAKTQRLGPCKPETVS
jgi:hypothetical protein